MSATEPVAGERADLLQSLATQRHFLRHTTRGLTDEQAAQRTTASELSLGGLIKHVALTERQWMRFIVDGPVAMSWDEASAGDWMAGFRMLDGETLAGLLETYAQVWLAGFGRWRRARQGCQDHRRPALTPAAGRGRRPAAPAPAPSPIGPPGKESPCHR